MLIDTKLITELRAQTGAGIGDCKSALEEAGGDIPKAIEVLRKKGAIKAAKKSDRATKEGVISILKAGNKVAVVGLACETDFVALNEDFIKTAQEFAQELLKQGSEEFKNWAKDKITNELIVKIGENIQLTDFEILTGETLGIYLHSNKKVAAVVIMEGGNEELAVNLAMQVTAMLPRYIKPEDIPPAEIAKEKEIYREQLKAEGKPEAMWKKIILGKLNKYYQEVCLLKQPYIKDDKITVEKLIEQEGKGIEVIKFSRYQI